MNLLFSYSSTRPTSYFRLVVDEDALKWVAVEKYISLLLKQFYEKKF